MLPVGGRGTSGCVRRPEPVGEGFGVCPPRNLAPADLKKDANGLDLPIALKLLLGSGQVAFDRPGSSIVVGELAITGEARSGWRIHVSGMVVATEQTWAVGDCRILVGA
jgi:Subunit ChlI of Mg-chelatase